MVFMLLEKTTEEWYTPKLWPMDEICFWFGVNLCYQICTEDLNDLWNVYSCDQVILKLKYWICYSVYGIL